jgi:hypothetical protein
MKPRTAQILTRALIAWDLGTLVILGHELLRAYDRTYRPTSSSSSSTAPVIAAGTYALDVRNFDTPQLLVCGHSVSEWRDNRHCHVPMFGAAVDLCGFCFWPAGAAIHATALDTDDGNRLTRELKARNRSHPFRGRADRGCEECGLPDRAGVHHDVPPAG